jgi:hypothetical protein
MQLWMQGIKSTIAFHTVFLSPFLSPSMKNSANQRRDGLAGSARALARSVASGRGVVISAVHRAGRPLLAHAGDQDELVPVLVVDGDEPLHIEFLDIALLHPSEVAFKQQHSLEVLFEHWYRHDVNYVDPRRPPEPV